MTTSDEGERQYADETGSCWQPPCWEVETAMRTPIIILLALLGWIAWTAAVGIMVPILAPGPGCVMQICDR
jgi:hypothetical protein